MMDKKVSKSMSKLIDIPDQVVNALELAKVALMSYAAEDAVSQGYGAGCRSNPDESIKATLGVIDRAIETYLQRKGEVESRGIAGFCNKCGGAVYYRKGYPGEYDHECPQRKDDQCTPR